MALDLNENSALTTSPRSPSDRKNHSRIYYPLDETKQDVRFMRVLGDGDSGLDCEVATFALSTEPEYIALSYRWTEAPATCKIQLNGHTFYVRPNLLGFLEQINEESLRYWIFVDSICINQADLDECSSQVRLMGDIYRNAKEVIVWAGNGGPWSEDLMEILCVRGESAATILNAISQKEDRWQALFHLTFPFFEGEYWYRVWIVQEIILASALTFRWKSYSMPSEVFYSLLHRLSQEAEYKWKADAPSFAEAIGFVNGKGFLAHGADMPFKSAVLAFAMLGKRLRLNPTVRNQIPIVESIKFLAYQHCARPYDKIFGTLGLSKSVLRADYRMPKMELYMRVAFEGVIQIDLASRTNPADYQHGYERTSLLVDFNVALLAALELSFDHPTVVLVTIKIYQLLRAHAEPWTLYALVCFVSLERKAFANSSFMLLRYLKIFIPAHAWIKSRMVRVLCHRWKYSPHLPPCDDSGTKTYNAWMMETENVYNDVARKMLRVSIRDLF